MRQKKEKNSKKLRLSSLKQALKIARYIKPHRVTFGIGLIFLLLSSAASLVFPALTGDLVDSASNEIMQDMDQVALSLLALFALQALFSYLRVVLFVRVTEKSVAALRQDTYSHLIRLPMNFFNKRRVGELNSRISADVSLLQETFTTTLAEFIRQMIIIIGGTILLASTSLKLTLFMLAVVPAIIVVTILFGKFIRRYSKKVQQLIADSNTVVEETLTGISNVKAFANEFFELGRYKTKTNEAAQVAIKGGHYRGAFASFIIFGLFGAIAAVIWFGGKMVQADEISIGTLLSFLLYTAFIGGSIGGLASVYANLQRAVGATENLMEILEEEPESVTLEETKLSSAIQGSVRFRDVNFHYASRKDVPVLNQLSFDIEPGEQIALVGPSGAGKSTIASLLLRFYDVTAGSIEIDGKNIKDFPLNELRSQMAIVPQDVILFGGTIRENIAYGKIGASEDEIVEAAKKANAHTFITDFPEGYDSLVGERGVKLSGGQRQRIAIARAVLRNPKILILDEATSALDSESERLVQEALEQLMEGRTSLVIAHRLATIRKADTILVLDKGQLKESGSHEELSQLEDGLYKNLSALQFS